MAVAGKFNIQVGSLKQSQMTGERSTVTQRIELSAEEAAGLGAVFAELKAKVAQRAPSELRDEALAQAEQLEHAVLCEPPSPRAIRRVVRWFLAHAPQLADTVTDVLATPVVGRQIEGGDTAAIER